MLPENVRHTPLSQPFKNWCRMLYSMHVKILLGLDKSAQGVMVMKLMIYYPNLRLGWYSDRTIGKVDVPW